jgi:hypothetical protein
MVAKQGLAESDVSTFLSDILSEFPTLATITCPFMFMAVLQKEAVQQALEVLKFIYCPSPRQRDEAGLGLILTLNALRTTTTTIEKLQIPVAYASINNFQASVPAALMREVLRRGVKEIEVHRIGSV